MPKIKLAKSIGFCAGVRRAITIVEQTLANSHAKAYSFGPVIHNAQVIRDLNEKGLLVTNSITKVAPHSILILPSHGSSGLILKEATKRKLNLVDVTCPNVSNLQKICRQLNDDGFEIVIFGDRRHPEVRALVDIADKAHIVEIPRDISGLKLSNNRIGLISQTTQNRDKFIDFVSKVLKNNSWIKEVRIFNTICLDTWRRQEEVKSLAKEVDVLFVIGSKFSANTKRLLNIGRKLNKKTFLIESASSPMKRFIKDADVVGLISGASAPDWLVKQIIKKLKGVKK